VFAKKWCDFYEFRLAKQPIIHILRRIVETKWRGIHSTALLARKQILTKNPNNTVGDHARASSVYARLSAAAL
jgi:hypothetical protein